MYRGVSASKSSLLLGPCLRWAGPKAKAYEDKNANTTKRDKGTLFHACMDHHYIHHDDKWLKLAHTDTDVCRWVVEAIGWSTEVLEPRCSEIHSEVYVAYNFDTGEVHVDDSVRDRKYPKKAGFIPGTADLVCVLRDGRLLVADWKTGGGVGADKQLLTLASGLRKVYLDDRGLPREVLLAVLYAGERGIMPNEWAVTESELQSHSDAMAFQLADVGKRNDPVVGIHCTQLYCPHLAYCPGITAVVVDESESAQALLGTQKLVRKYKMTDKPSSPEEAGFTMERITAARRQMDYYETAIRRFHLEGGKVVSGDFEYAKKADGFRWRPRK